jgi:ADP-heptose:LPS heptosyltransferase/glycosyltransferase involved in cell wall biosynthesis
MNIVWFGQRNWDDCGPSGQQLLRRLARRGHRVLHVDPGRAGRPASPAARWRGRCEVRQVLEGLHVVSLRPLPSSLGRLADRMDRLTLRAAAERLGLWAPVAICASPAHAKIVKAISPAALVYFAQSDGPLATGTPPHEAAEAERMVRQADLALADSVSLLDRLRSLTEHCFLQEWGVDVDLFHPGALELVEPLDAVASLPRPRIGFVGEVDETLDRALLARLAQRLPGSSIVIAVEKAPGGLQDLEVLGSNVRVLPIDQRQSPGVYRELDVALLPTAPTAPRRALPRGRVYEYLAADLPTVATSATPLNGASSAVTVAEDDDGFIRAVQAALENPDHLRDERRKAAESASWQRRADQLEQRLDRAQELAQERRKARGEAPPRPDRHGRQAVQVEPRLDGKDASVRLLHDNYVNNGLSPQQHALYLLSRVLGIGYYLLRRAGRLLRGDLTAVRRILVVRNGHLGDTVVFLPTLAALRARYPGARITVALSPGSGAQPLLDASPYVDEVLPLDFFNRSRRDRFIGAARLLGRGFDLAVGGVWYFHLPEAVFAGAPLRLGLYDGHPLQRYADRVVMLDPNLHEAENNLRLVELVTGPVPKHLRVPRLSLDEPILASRAAQMRRRMGIAPGAPVVAMHPGSKRPSRRWPASGFAELAEALLAERPDLHVVCTGAGAEEQALIADIRSQVRPDLRQRLHNAVGLADLLGVVGFYDTCRLLVCNDTGVMHVARARGVPLVALIGPENDRRWGPHPLGFAPAVAVRQQVPGTPHGKWSCPWNLSLASIDSGRIKHHVDALLDGSFERINQIAPIESGGQRLYPLLADVHRLSFAQLRELGLRLPRVAAILASDPALLGGEGQRADGPTLAAAARGMRRQVYPGVHTLLLTDAPEELAELDVGEATIIATPPGDPDAAWTAALSKTDALLIWPTTAESHPPTAISSRVGVYLRGPHASVVDGERAFPTQKLMTENLLSGRWLLTRAALEEMLIHPLPPVEAPAEDPSEVLALALA